MDVFLVSTVITTFVFKLYWIMQKVYIKNNPLHGFLSVTFAHTCVSTGMFLPYSVLYTFTEYSLWIIWRLPAVSRGFDLILNRR